MMAAASVAELAPELRPSPRKFHEVWVGPGTPVVLRAAASDWKARTWAFPGISPPLRALGMTSVRLRSAGPEGRSLARELTLAELDGQLADEATSPSFILDVLGDAPALAREFPSALPGAPLTELSLLLGRNTVAAHHYHPARQSLLYQVHGTKRVVLHRPRDCANLYPQPVTSTANFHVSRVDVLAPDLRRFPRFERARPMTATLHPGDAILIPVGWWHTVTGDGPVLSVRFTWRARLRDRPFPRPAVRDLGGSFYWGLRHHAGGWVRRCST